MVAKSLTRTEQAVGQVETWAGTIRVEASAYGVQSVQLPKWVADPAEPRADSGTVLVGGSIGARRHLQQVLSEVAEYFAGTRKDFTVPLDLGGAPFFSRVWEEVRGVPYGETRSYQEIAGMLGAPAANRAVGAANGANPVAPLVPCHRIVGSDGNLTGYGPGLPLKRLLLVMEDAIPANQDDYPAWVERVAVRLGTSQWVLGLRHTREYCPPLEAPLPLRVMPNRCFPSHLEAQLAGYHQMRRVQHG